MRVLAAVVVLAVVLAGCSSAAEPYPAADAPVADAPSAAAEPAEASSPTEPAEPAEASSPAEAAADEPADTFTAEDAIAAIEAAGLPIGDVRDTSDACADIGCEARLTTDYVSAYQWSSAEEAAANESFGPGREWIVVGPVVLHFGGDSGYWPFDTGPYIDAAEAAAP